MSSVSSASEALEGATAAVSKPRREFIDSSSASPMVSEEFDHGDELLELKSVLACTNLPFVGPQRLLSKGISGGPFRTSLQQNANFC